MKKLLVLLALVLLPLFAGAQDANNLLTPDGTFCMIRQSDQPTDGNAATTYLVLTTRRGDVTRTAPVPATLTAGVHSNPAMAYDAESGTLYVFWLRYTKILESELLFASLDSRGAWSEATSFGSGFDYRENLKIAVTRKVVDEKARLQPGITVHATWWETDTHSGSEAAKYAILVLENGRVAEVNFLDLGEFVAQSEKSEADLSKDDLTILRHPVLTMTERQESVLLTFGSLETLSLHRVRVYPVKPPVTDGRIRIPVGRAEGKMDAPKFGRIAANSSVTAIGGEERMAFYTRDGEKLHYVLLRDGQWSEARAITLDDQISAPAAVEAIRRLVNEH
jgi:hypothetical protein